MTIGNIQSSASESWDCSICLEPLSGISKKIVSKCTHIAHQACINTWLAKNANCPDCRERWEVVLITDAVGPVQLNRELMKNYSKQIATIQSDFAMKEAEFLKNSEKATKKHLGEWLDQLNEAQWKNLAAKIEETKVLGSNMQTFFRGLYNPPEDSYSKEANEMWYHIKYRLDNTDIVFQILIRGAKTYFATFEQLKRCCIRCGMSPDQIERILDEIKLAWESGK